MEVAGRWENHGAFPWREFHFVTVQCQGFASEATSWYAKMLTEAENCVKVCDIARNNVQRSFQVKARLRRAVAHKKLANFEEARTDLRAVLRRFGGDQKPPDKGEQKPPPEKGEKASSTAAAEGGGSSSAKQSSCSEPAVSEGPAQHAGSSPPSHPNKAVPVKEDGSSSTAPGGSSTVSADSPAALQPFLDEAAKILKEVDSLLKEQNRNSRAVPKGFLNKAKGASPQKDEAAKLSSKAEKETADGLKDLSKTLFAKLQGKEKEIEEAANEARAVEELTGKLEAAARSEEDSSSGSDSKKKPGAKDRRFSGERLLPPVPEEAEVSADPEEASGASGGTGKKTASSEQPESSFSPSSRIKSPEKGKNSPAKPGSAGANTKKSPATSKKKQEPMLYADVEAKMKPVREKIKEEDRTLNLERELFNIVSTNDRDRSTNLDEYRGKREQRYLDQAEQLDMKKKVLEKLDKEDKWEDDDEWVERLDNIKRKKREERRKMGRERALLGDGNLKDGIFPKNGGSDDEGARTAVPNPSTHFGHVDVEIERWVQTRLRELLVGVAIEAGQDVEADVLRSSFGMGVNGQKLDGYCLKGLVADVGSSLLLLSNRQACITIITIAQQHN